MNYKKIIKKVGGERMFRSSTSKHWGNKKTAGKSEGVFTWKLGFQVSPASKWGDEKIKGFVKLLVIGVVAMIGLFGFYRGAASSALLRTAKEAGFSSDSGMMS